MAVTQTGLLLDRILEVAARDPQAVAFISSDAPTTYREMRALLAAAVRRLREEGIKPGDPVALTMSQSPLHTITFLALARLGALVVPVTPFLRPADRIEAFRKYAVRIAISDRSDAAPPGVPLLLLQSLSAKGDDALGDSGFTPAADTPLRIAMTSGTTGVPRGTLQTQGRFLQRLDRMECDVVERPRVLPPNLHITTGLMQAMHALCRGGTVVFPRGYDTEPFFDAIRRHGVTHVGLPPANLALMLEALPEDGPAFPTIRHLRIMGGTPSPEFLERTRRRFSPNIYLPYGLGEIGIVAMATPETLAREPRSAGPLLPDVRMDVLDEAGRVLPRGETGEIRVSFDGMATSYYGPDAGDRTRFRDGWFHPGDFGHISAQGLVFVEGRIDDIVNIGGRKVSPRFVETILEEFPGVREAAVFVDGEDPAGKRIAAAIVSSGAVDLAKLDAYARKELDVRAPARYVAVESLPRNAMGKLIRSELERFRSAPAG